MKKKIKRWVWGKWECGMGAVLGKLPQPSGLGLVRGCAPSGNDAFCILISTVAASPRKQVLLQCKCQFLQFIHLKR